MTVAKAIEVLADALISDRGYRQTWQANMASAFYDTFRDCGCACPDGELHAVVNQGADRFLEILTGFRS